MDALSLSHLTYRCETLTFNFHRLDHPPFPCTGRLLLSRFAGKRRQGEPQYISIVLVRIPSNCSEGGKDFMKPATIVGILLVVLGIIGFATGGLSFTHQKKDVDVGPVQISHKTQDTLPLSPIFSTVSLIAGVALVVVGARAK
jgi:hypothetical protein